MAEPRAAPFMTASWLSKIMSGEVACQWGTWFQAHFKLTQKQPDDFDSASWQIAHTRMLTELIQALAASGQRIQKEVSLSIDVPQHRTSVRCRSDCLVFGDQALTVYDCKTGKRRHSDQIQVMIYLYAVSLNPRFHGLQRKGVVVYKDGRAEIPDVCDSFVSDLHYFTGLLTADEPPLRAPGGECRFCSLTVLDCPERVD